MTTFSRRAAYTVDSNDDKTCILPECSRILWVSKSTGNSEDIPRYRSAYSACTANNRKLLLLQGPQWTDSNNFMTKSVKLGFTITTVQLSWASSSIYLLNTVQRIQNKPLVYEINNNTKEYKQYLWITTGSACFYGNIMQQLSMVAEFFQCWDTAQVLCRIGVV